ncbi:hypothetical protein A6R68_22460, partial [Neotoma lepida]
MAASKETTVGPLVGAVVQGTNSTRFLVFNAKTAELLSHHHVELTQEYPKEGWVEQDPKEILQSVYECIEKTCEKLAGVNIDISNIKAVGVSNQRETTVVWDKFTGDPLYNAVVWLDLRTQSTVEILSKKIPGNSNFVKSKTGLPLSTYFSAVKLRWMLDNLRPIQKAVEEGRALFGTIDSWLIWSMTGGVNGGVHCTDVTNASRTMLFNIHSLEWDKDLCDFFEIPMNILPNFTNKCHIAFAALEAVCFQTREILDAMNRDCGIPLSHLQVDGGMTNNKILMQLQADILRIPVVKSVMPETTALGVAMAAGAAEGVDVWSLEPEDMSAVLME